MITISEITSESDFPTLAQVEDQAFGESPLLSLLFKTETPQDRERSIKERTWRHTKCWKEDPACTYLKATTDDNEIVGMGVWYFYTKPGQFRDPWLGLNEMDVNQSLCDYYFGTFRKTQQARMGEHSSYAFLADLVVKPSWQGKGVGSQLLAWGIQRMEDQQLDCWLDASRHGLPLYKKYGWEEVETLDFDMSPWTGSSESKHQNVCMIRRFKRS